MFYEHHDTFYIAANAVHDAATKYVYDTFQILGSIKADRKDDVAGGEFSKLFITVNQEKLTWVN